METETSKFNQTCEDSNPSFETATDQQHDLHTPVKNNESCLDMADDQEPGQDAK